MTDARSRSFSFADLFEIVVETLPDREAIVCGNQRYTYAELNRRADALAGYLVSRGVTRGDNVGLQMTNCPAYVESFLAACKIGAVPFNVNYRYRDSELRYLFDNSDAKAIVYNHSLADAVEPALEAATDLKVAMCVGGDQPADASPIAGYEAALDSSAEPPTADGRDGNDLIIIYTGGTTGMPKGVMWPHQSLFFGALGGGGYYHPAGAVKTPDELANRVTEGPHLRTFPVAPLMHGAALWTALTSLFAGHTLVLNASPSFDAEAVWDLAAAEHVNIMAIVGDAMATPMVDALEANPERWNLQALVHVGSGGAVFSGHLQERLKAALPQVQTTSSLGATETGTMGPGTRPTDEGLMRYEPRPDLAVVVDAQRLAEPGETGIIARPGMVPVGYYGDPEKSAQTFVSINGVPYALGGDAARLEEDGAITVLGRGSTCINTGGEKVFPEEVEQVLKSHPAVSDAMVVGVPHPRFTQAVAAVVALGDGQEADADSLQDHCRTELAGYKVPRQICFRDELQRSPAGKPDYRWAAEQLTE